MEIGNLEDPGTRYILIYKEKINTERYKKEYDILLVN